MRNTKHSRFYIFVRLDKLDRFLISLHRINESDRVNSVVLLISASRIKLTRDDTRENTTYES